MLWLKVEKGIWALFGQINGKAEWTIPCRCQPALLPWTNEAECQESLGMAMPVFLGALESCPSPAPHGAELALGSEQHLLRGLDTHGKVWEEGGGGVRMASWGSWLLLSLYLWCRSPVPPVSWHSRKAVWKRDTHHCEFVPGGFWRTLLTPWGLCD